MPKHWEEHLPLPSKPSSSTAAACCMGLTLAGGLAGSAFLSPQHGVPTTERMQPTTKEAISLRGAARQGASDTWAPGVCAGSFVLGLAGAAVGRTYQRRKSLLDSEHPAYGRSTGLTARKVTLTTTMTVEEEEQEVMSPAMDNANLVKKNSVLVLGATGTLGRQVVRQFLNAGYSVRCMIRNKADRPFSFLVDWGATVIEGSLARPDTLPSGLIGIHTVIDCATARPEESIYDIDWDGKKRFIQCCDKMGIQRYVFISIKDCDKYQSVPLMQIKNLTEKFLAKTSLRYTILRVSGFMQPLISEYAVNVLDDQKVWGDDGSSPGIAYMDSQDCARMVAAAVNKERTVGQTLTLSGPKIWSASEVIALCERLSGREADTNIVSNGLLQLTQNAASCFQWTVDVAERLRFVEVNQQGDVGGTKVMTPETYAILGMDPSNTRNLEEYFSEFYRRVFKKLTRGKYEAEPGEVEREKAEDERKLQVALTKDLQDSLPPGQPEEKDVSVLLQREISDQLQRIFEDEKIEQFEGDEAQWFGWTKIAEDFNGRASMIGFTLGLFTEWATNVSVSKQIDELTAIFAPPQ